MRWRHPERGLVSPLEFIPFAESSVCIDRMTDWVLEAACVQLKAWDAAGCVLQMAVNLSARSLHDSRIADRFEPEFEKLLLLAMMLPWPGLED